MSHGRSQLPCVIMDNTGTEDELAQLPMWKTYLYRLEQVAPRPKSVVCHDKVSDRPPYYGDEFHGIISRDDADLLLTADEDDDGRYLIRESQRAKEQYTLAIRFEEATKNFRLYYDGQHFVGDKRFDTVHDLVADGLIIFYLESKAADYISALSTCCNYAESPYYSAYRRAHQLPPLPLPVPRSPRSTPRMGTARRLASVGSRASPSTPASPALSAGGGGGGGMSPRLSERSSGAALERRRRLKSPEMSNGQHRRQYTSPARQFSFDVGRSAVLVDSCDLRRPSAGNVVIGSGLELATGSLKSHVFRVHTFKGPHWCDFCANYMWGLIAQGVKCQDCGFNAHKRCSEKVPADCQPDMKHVKKTFGVDLTTLVTAQNSLVPTVVRMCIDEIETRGMDSEGLYRVSGFHSDIEAIKLSFDKDGDRMRPFADQCRDVHTIAGVLKLFFRLLPIPLITFDVYFHLISTISRDDISKEERLEEVRFGVAQLPAAHFHTLKYLINHLHRVASHQHTNLMGAENLATVFAPNLLRSPESEVQCGWSALKHERDLIELLIRHCNLLD